MGCVIKILHDNTRLTNFFKLSNRQKQKWMIQCGPVSMATTFTMTASSSMVTC